MFRPETSNIGLVQRWGSRNLNWIVIGWIQFRSVILVHWWSFTRFFCHYTIQTQAQHAKVPKWLQDTLLVERSWCLPVDYQTALFICTLLQINWRSGERICRFELAKFTQHKRIVYRKHNWILWLSVPSNNVNVLYHAWNIHIHYSLL